jgi:AcrR family transcriptional regulator
MTKRDAEGKRRQLLAAGLTEFAAHGIAGARVDRIAKLAGCSAGLVYTYFTSKDELFDAVFDAVLEQGVTEAPITVEDLPGYAGRLFDSRQAHPALARLVTWYALERPGSTRPAAVEAAKAKVEAIRAAQNAGRIAKRFAPEQLLWLVLQLAARGSLDPHDPFTGADPAVMRKVIVDAVRRLVEPQGRSTGHETTQESISGSVSRSDRDLGSPPGRSC